MFSIRRKKERDFFPYDVVVSKKYKQTGLYSIGLVTEVTKKTFRPDKISVSYFQKGRLNPMMTYFIVKWLASCYEGVNRFELYQPVRKLIRPLVKGDKIFMSYEKDIYLSNRVRMYFEEETISAIIENPDNPYQPFYSIEGKSYQFLEINIDIDRTNRLLLKENRPLTLPGLPDL